MEIQPQNSSLIQVALLGTESKQLDTTAFPQVLRSTIQQILQEAQDSEDAFFQIAALNFSYAMSTEQVKLNSFSIEEMARYQQLQSNLKPQASESTTEQSEAADPLLAKVQMHSGPLPLPFVNDYSSVFLPDAVGVLINRVVANYDTMGYKELLYWTLRKLEHCHMVLPPQYVFPLVERVFAQSSHRVCFFDIGRKYKCLSYFMLREQMFRIGDLGLRYALKYFAPEDFSSVFTQPEFVARWDAHDGHVDYDYMFKHADLLEAQGAWRALRWQDPTRARELLQKYWNNRIKKVDDKLEFLELLHCNLSLADEQFLTHITQTEPDDVRGKATWILRNIVGSNYAKRCAQQFLAHVQYLGTDNKQSDKGGLKIERFAYSDELKALGVRNPKEPKPTSKGSREMLRQLVWGMDLSDLLALTGHANEPQLAFKILLQHISYSPIFDDATSLEGILVRKIYLAKDAGAAEAFLQQDKRDDVKTYSLYGSLVQLLAPEKREQYLKSELYKQSEYTLSGHFLAPESEVREIDFNPLQDTWAKQLLDMMYECCSMAAPIEAFMFWPYSMIDVIKQYISEQQQRKNWSGKLKWLEKMLAGLELKRQIDELLKTVV